MWLVSYNVNGISGRSREGLNRCKEEIYSSEHGSNDSTVRGLPYPPCESKDACGGKNFHRQGLRNLFYSIECGW